MLVISDLHWRCDTPSWRKEPDYAQALRHKLGKLLDMGEAVCVAGDLFHRADDFEAVFDLFTFLKAHNTVLYAVPGQHDQVYHNTTLVRTGFNLLVHAGLVIPLSRFPQEIGDSVMVSGMGWGEDIPGRPADILIAHVPVSYTGAPYAGSESAQAFRQKAAKFKYVFTGDNHQRFVLPEPSTYQGRFILPTGGLFNAGCFHRMTSDLANQPPAAWHVTPEGVSLFEIPCPPPLVDEAYMHRQSEGKAKVAGTEFVKALAEARQQGGGDVFLEVLKKAVEGMDAGAREMTKELIKICEEAHT